MSRPRAETTPAVTVPPRPNGLPTAITQSPIRGSRSANLTNGKSFAFHLDECDVGLGSVPITLAQDLAVVRHHLDGLGMVDHVVVGHGIAVGGDEEARALRRQMLARRNVRHILLVLEPELPEETLERRILSEGGSLPEGRCVALAPPERRNVPLIKGSGSSPRRQD